MTSTPPPGAFDYLLDLKRPAAYEPPRPPRRKVVAPRAVVPPPPPPERGGGGNQPPRLRIEIEIVHRPATEARRGASAWWAVVLLWATVLAILLGLALPVRADDWRTSKHGWETRIDGTGPDGSQWSGRQYKQGFTTFTDLYGQDGRAVHCRTVKTGWQTRTECN